MEAVQTNKYTYEEYLKIEETSELKHEFFYGELFTMQGTTKVHNKIVFSTTVAFTNNLKKRKECEVFFEAVKVRIKEKGHYAYPDVVISCNKMENDPLTIKYPILIVEVLSDSTRNYDRDKKFMFYKQIPSLKHYVLIEQDKCFVTSYTKQNDFWVHKAFSEMDDTINIEHLDINISVKDIYENISLKEEEALIF